MNEFQRFAGLQDDLVLKLVEQHGTKKWGVIAAGLVAYERTGKQVSSLPINLTGLLT
jgi:hypothetical protein